MAAPPKCDICDSEHWAHQAHRFAKNVVEIGPFVEVEPGPAVTIRAAMECEVCGTEFDSRRSDARFCGAKCRQVSSRKRRSRGVTEAR
jgi:hypothetical protein